MNRTAILIALVAFAAVGCKTAAPLPPKAVALNQSGAAALAAGDLATAEARIALALEYNPRFVEAWTNLGLIELRRGNFEAAYRDLRKARDLNDDLPTPHHAIGLLFDQRGMGREAEANYRAALKVDPGFAPARVNLGRRLFARGAFDEAQEQFLRLTQVSPETLDGWLGLSESLLQLGREAEADEVLTKIQTRFPDAPEASLLVGRKLLRDEKYEEAEATFGRLTDYPDKTRSAAAWSWIAMARLGRGDAARAVDAAKAALAIDREHAVATYAMGIALRMRGDAAADAWLERANKLSPRNVAVLPREGRP